MNRLAAPTASGPCPRRALPSAVGSASTLATICTGGLAPTSGRVTADHLVSSESCSVRLRGQESNLCVSGLTGRRLATWLPRKRVVCDRVLLHFRGVVSNHDQPGPKPGVLPLDDPGARNGRRERMATVFIIGLDVVIIPFGPRERQPWFGQFWDVDSNHDFMIQRQVSFRLDDPRWDARGSNPAYPA
jgi:hypothetical protein